MLFGFIGTISQPYFSLILFIIAAGKQTHKMVGISAGAEKQNFGREKVCNYIGNILKYFVADVISKVGIDIMEITNICCCNKIFPTSVANYCACF